MAEAAAAVVETPAITEPAAPAVPNIVGDAAAAPATQATPAAAAPALTVAAVDPALAKAYLTEHGMSAEDVAKIPEADLAKKYDEAKAAEAAKPIEYKDFTLPKDVTIDQTKLADIKSEFAKAKLTQDQAQSLVDRHVAGLKANQEANIAAFTKLQEEWIGKVKADPQIGGANFDSKTVPAIAKAIDTFCTDDASRKEFREAVSLTGIGNHPAYVRFMARLGSSLMEGQPVSGGKPAAQPKSFEAMAEKMYGNSPKLT